MVSITNVSVQEVQSFFGFFGGGKTQTKESESRGTGIIIGKNESELLIVTNNHVVEDSTTLTVCFVDNEACEAVIKGLDPDNDLAVIAVKLSDIKDETAAAIKIAMLGDSDSLKVGQQVVAIGNALGYGQSVTTGIVSALGRKIDTADAEMIQTDAAINPGNSGGPLLSSEGLVIGVNTFIMSEGQNLGFALHYSLLRKALAEYVAAGKVYAVRCVSCANLVTENTLQAGYCPYCGVKMNQDDFKGKLYIPGIAERKIEDMLTSLGYDINIVRESRDSWVISDENLDININYSPENGHISTSCILCRLPQEDIGRMYGFLMHQNYKMPGLTFSVSGGHVTLSTRRISGADFHSDTCCELLEGYIAACHRFSDILINRYYGIPSGALQ
jgi:hypothetical protein